jgi:hypothetical protein
VIAAVVQLWPAILAAAVLGLAAAGAWVRGVYRAGQAVQVFDIVARQLGLIRCDAACTGRKEEKAKPPVGARVDGQFIPSENGAHIRTEPA